MIREQSRFAINPVYVVGVALCCICANCISLQTGLLLGGITVAAMLLCVNLISFAERIADKNLRAFLIAMLVAAIVVVCEYVFKLIDTELFISNIDNLKYVLLAVICLSIVPTYFETRLTTKDYFSNMLFSVIMFFVLTSLYSFIIEFLGYGTMWGYNVIPGFTGYAFATQFFFELFVVAVLVLISNLIYQKIEDKHMQFALLVERYKVQIIASLKNKQKEAKHD